MFTLTVVIWTSQEEKETQSVWTKGMTWGKINGSRKPWNRPGLHSRYNTLALLLMLSGSPSSHSSSVTCVIFSTGLVRVRRTWLSWKDSRIASQEVIMLKVIITVSTPTLCNWSTPSKKSHCLLKGWTANSPIPPECWQHHAALHTFYSSDTSMYLLCQISDCTVIYSRGVTSAGSVILTAPLSPALSLNKASRALRKQSHIHTCQLYLTLKCFWKKTLTFM